jgi:hypothetical protein
MKRSSVARDSLGCRWALRRMERPRSRLCRRFVQPFTGTHVCFASPMVQAPAYPPGERVVPLFARGPSPAATAANPTTTTGRYTPPAHPRPGSGVRPPAASAVPMCAPAASTGGTSDNLQQTPCHSRNPPTPKGHPAFWAPHPPKGLPSPVAGRVYTVRHGVDSVRHVLFQATTGKAMSHARRVSTLSYTSPRLAQQTLLRMQE